jgi:hypothetical protein
MSKRVVGDITPEMREKILTADETVAKIQDHVGIRFETLTRDMCYANSSPRNMEQPNSSSLGSSLARITTASHCPVYANPSRQIRSSDEL